MESQILFHYAYSKSWRKVVYYSTNFIFIEMRVKANLAKIKWQIRDQESKVELKDLVDLLQPERDLKIWNS